MQATKSFILISAFCFLMAAGIACASASSASDANRPARPTPTSEIARTPEITAAGTTDQPGGKQMEAKQISANNEFGFDLFNQLRSEDKGKNVFFSPLSVAFALAMTYNGAAGETKAAMQKALKIEGISHAELNQANATLMSTL